MFKILAKFPSGNFTMKKGQLLKNVNNAPNGYGVYLIYLTFKNGKKYLAYIGASGTVNQKGEMGTQTLNKRINNKQRDIKRQDFFEIILEENVNSIYVEWFVTFDDQLNFLPKYVESELIQEYFNNLKKLPIFNKNF